MLQEVKQDVKAMHLDMLRQFHQAQVRALSCARGNAASRVQPGLLEPLRAACCLVPKVVGQPQKMLVLLFHQI